MFSKNVLADANVFDHVKAYLKEHLPNYELMFVVHASDYRMDNYLYMVEAKRKIPSKYNQGDYAVWTTWNESTHSLNGGHYDIETENDCSKLIDEFYTYAELSRR